MSTILLAGVDEAGRGPLAGPVIAAAVILDPNQPIEGLTDSKKLSEKKRNALYEEVILKALAYGVGRAEVHEIDELNILWASMLAMERAVAALPTQPTHVQVDGNRCPKVSMPCEAIVKGDLLVPEISAASIIAKVQRDREMHELDLIYPQYGFAKHSGYPTKAHISNIDEYGVSDVHRRSFGPVRKKLAQTLF